MKYIATIAVLTIIAVVALSGNYDNAPEYRYNLEGDVIEVI